jgi:hypothetical protein
MQESTNADATRARRAQRRFRSAARGERDAAARAALLDRNRRMAPNRPKQRRRRSDPRARQQFARTSRSNAAWSARRSCTYRLGRRADRDARGPESSPSDRRPASDARRSGAAIRLSRPGCTPRCTDARDASSSPAPYEVPAVRRSDWTGFFAWKALQNGLRATPHVTVRGPESSRHTPCAVRRGFFQTDNSQYEGVVAMDGIPADGTRSVPATFRHPPVYGYLPTVFVRSLHVNAVAGCRRAN